MDRYQSSNKVKKLPVRQIKFGAFSSFSYHIEITASCKAPPPERLYPRATSFAFLSFWHPFSLFLSRAVYVGRYL
jgi:hypothetical protein